MSDGNTTDGYVCGAVKCPLVLVLALLLTAAGSAAGRVELYVSPQGNDSNPGTREKPLATVRGARDTVRNLKDEGPLEEPVTVILRGGTYRLEEPLRFTPRDSGSEENPITYRAAEGEKPILSGGMTVEGWTKKGNVWQARVPEVRAGDLYFRQLFVNGTRAIRARTPNRFYLRTAGPIKPIQGRRHKSRHDPSTKRGFRFREGDIRRFENLDDVCIELYHSWTSSLHWIDELDIEDRTVRFTNRCDWPVGYWEKYERYRIENYRGALDSPGEWYLDRDDGTLYYWPRRGENMDEATVVAPRLKDLVVFNGDPGNEKYVENIHFEGLHFRHEDWHFDRDRKVDGQAHASKMTAAIKAFGLRDSSFRDCEIAHVGTHALWMAKGCQDNDVTRCHIHDCGGGGIYVGEPGKVAYMPDSDAVKVMRNTLDNNFIHHTSRVLGGSIGIWVGSSAYNTISDNEISDFDYTGISVGWSWGRDKDIFQQKNIIEWNHIHHNVGDILSDNGGIYVLGHSPGSVMRNNVVHHIRHYPHINTSNGLYLDGHTSGYTVENNLVYDIMGQGVLTKGQDNVIRHNILAFCEENGIWRLADKEDRHVTIKRNIIVQEQGYMISGYCHPSRFAQIDHNLYWATGDHEVLFEDLSARLLSEVSHRGEMGFEGWQHLGHDEHSLAAKPEFADVEERNFRLQENSPAERIGFETFDLDRAGLYGDPEWVSMPDQVEREPHTFAPPPSKPPVDYTFEGSDAGSWPSVRGRLTREGKTSILVSDEAAASGQKSLKFTDGRADKGWYPAWSIRFDAGEKGTVSLRCDIMNAADSPAKFNVEFRDWSGSDYKTGPMLRINREGAVSVGGRKLASVEPGRWAHLEVSFQFGPDAPDTFTLKLTPRGGDTRVFEDLAFVDKSFATLTWFGFSSLGNQKAAYYVDNLKLTVEE